MVRKNRTVFISVVVPVCVECDDVKRWSIYRTVQFFICSKTGVVHVTAFKYSLHKFSETILY